MKRRSFLTVTGGAAMAASRRVPAEDDPGNIKIAHIVPSGAADDFLRFCRQIGLRWVRLNHSGDPGVDALREVQKRFAQHGLSIYSATHGSYRSLRIQLGRPGRDEDIETYRTFLRSLGKLGIAVAPYDFHPANTYTTSEVERRGYRAREFSESDFRARVEKRAFERDYSAADMWGFYTYFVKAALPAAEEAGVSLALHPDDPPLAVMNGVAKLFVNYAGYRKAEEIAGPSRHWGLRLCVGTWAEGGASMGKDVFAMIRDFGGRGKLFDIDFRNVSGVMPRFAEACLDDGDLDMYRVMRALREVKYASGMVPDHIPRLDGDGREQRAGLAYSIAYMRGLLRRANEEAG
jgi:mannonate dehydratase